MSIQLCINPAYESYREFISRVPQILCTDEGNVIRKARNELRELDYKGQHFVVKSFAIPNLINRVAYGWLRSGKAQRSFENAEYLISHGIGSPEPVAWIAERQGLFYSHSYYICLKSECPQTYADILSGQVEREDEVLEAIAQTTAHLHAIGLLHRDYSRGNILIGFQGDGSIQIELIDLNRIRYHQSISVEAGLQNLFERLPVTPHQHEVMEQAYRKARKREEVER